MFQARRKFLPAKHQRNFKKLENMSTQTEKFEEYKLIYNFINPDVPLKGWINEKNHSNLYAKDWSELMEVVEKIEETHIVDICGKAVSIHHNNGEMIIDQSAKNSSTKIEAVYTACLEFIKRTTN